MLQIEYSKVISWSVNYRGGWPVGSNNLIVHCPSEFEGKDYRIVYGIWGSR